MNEWTSQPICEEEEKSTKSSENRLFLFRAATLTLDLENYV